MPFHHIQLLIFSLFNMPLAREDVEERALRKGRECLTGTKTTSGFLSSWTKSSYKSSKWQTSFQNQLWRFGFMNFSRRYHATYKVENFLITFCLTNLTDNNKFHNNSSKSKKTKFQLLFASIYSLIITFLFASIWFYFLFSLTLRRCSKQATHNLIVFIVYLLKGLNGNLARDKLATRKLWFILNMKSWWKFVVSIFTPGKN